MWKNGVVQKRKYISFSLQMLGIFGGIESRRWIRNFVGGGCSVETARMDA